MPESGDLQDVFKQAAKIAAVVPESMQEAAFNRALDMLTGGDRPREERGATQRRTTKRRGPDDGGGGGASTTAADRAAQVTTISRANAAEVDQETSVQGRSIALLVAAKREADVDGLTAPEIAKILTEKFRHKTSRQAVTQAMDAAGNRIDHSKEGRATLYRVMQAGEDWLSTPSDQRTAGGRSRRRGNAKKAAAPPPAKKTSTAKKAVAAKKTASPGGGRKDGPKSVLESLITEGYFTEPRGMGDIRQYVRDQRAINLSNNDLSPTLIRLLREKKLKRSKGENQYVYTAV